MKRSPVVLLTVAVVLSPGWPSEIRGQGRSELPGDSIRLDGRTRTYWLYAPPMPPPAPGLLLVLHGGGGDAERIRLLTDRRAEEEADRHGFLVVYPDGFDHGWNGCGRSWPQRANVDNVDDVRFLRVLVNRIVESRGVDPSRVWALGFSNGGHLALRLALEAPDDFRAVAAVAASLPTEEELDCVPSGRPASVMIINGTADPINPYDGGEVRTEKTGRSGVVRSSMESARYFAALNGSPDEPELTLASSSAGSRIDLARWTGPTGHEVVLVTVQGAGHSIPGSTAPFPAQVGPVDRGFDAVAAAVDFFRRVSD